ncbi:MAG: hypothetical protein ACU85V_02605 [Gammaproteobacteria bacterium]
MKHTAALLVLAALLAGCRSHTVVDRHQLAPLAAAPGDALALLGRSRGLAGHPDADFVACVTRELAARAPGLEVIGEREFVDALYPWFEAATAPSDVAMLKPLLENAGVRRRFDELGVKYLVWIQGRTETVDEGGAITCAAGPGGGGCFGFKSWEDEADYEAALWRVDDQAHAGKISTRTHGTSYIPAVIVPLPLLARVKDAACDSMAAQIGGYLDSTR